MRVVSLLSRSVVFDNAKILILKLITTETGYVRGYLQLYLIMQRY